jgi:hypothetical protein
VGVAADDRLLRNARKALGEPLQRAVNQHDLLVVAGGGVAEQDRAEPIDVEADGEREGGQVVALLAGELLARPDDAWLMGAPVGW